MIKSGVSVLISTYNWHTALELSLISLLKQTVLPNEIIIADDGSTKETEKLVIDFSKKTDIPIKFCTQLDLGFRLSLARNNGLKECEYSYVIQIDGDIICQQNFIEDHLYYSKRGYFLSGKRCDLNSNDTKITLETKKLNLSNESLSKTKIHYKKRNAFFYFMFRFPLLNKLIDTGLRGCNMSFWLEDALAINGYNTKIEGWGKEDNEFALRLNRLGIKKKTLKYGAIAYHLEHAMRNLDNLKKNEGILEEILNSKEIIIDSGIKNFKKDN